MRFLQSRHSGLTLISTLSSLTRSAFQAGNDNDDVDYDRDLGHCGFTKPGCPLGLVRYIAPVKSLSSHCQATVKGVHNDIQSLHFDIAVNACTFSRPALSLLISASRPLSGVPLSDISIIFLHRAMTRYCR